MKIPKSHRIIVLLVLLCCGAKVWGQDYPWLTHNNFMVEARVHAGVFWHHHFEMQKFNARYPALEVSVCQSTFGKKGWEPYYNYPYIGVTFYHANFGFNFEGNPKVGEALGSAFALYPYINYPLNPNENSQITLKMGVGLGYLTKCFDNFDNYYNFAIGSHINAAVNLSFEYRQSVTRQLMTVASFGLTHFSNGSTKLPNYGLNTFSSAFGVAYYLRQPRINLTPAKRPIHIPFEFDGRHWFSFDLNYGLGFKNVSQTLGGDTTHYYHVHELSSYLLVPFSPFSSAGLSFSAALDLSDQKLPDHIVNNDGLFVIRYNVDKEKNDTINITTLQMTKLNLGLCYSMTMDRLSYFFELGMHLRYNRFTDLSKGTFYQKVTARYRIYNNLHAHIDLMTHYGRADYLCVGLGYRFNQKYYIHHAKKTRHAAPGLRKRRFWFL